ncbi:hypothetical protein [Pseudidiomarina andamanensis]|uniref:Uncharacterized protein n=1 Tax=Pseudidiomarina andamanensis TaxID=1940690 RepID=A0AA92ILH8_9GAMM|nr:hypothetical protein [Pseudidiomarina andamanensis]MDS0218545.1 hypothetical protein [Pseudidiomarina andamanensis]QGT95413.1 hypothetical protein D3795_04140 [Pseudidiomarina andamanensis]
MGIVSFVSRITRRLGLWFLAAGITLAVMFTAVLIYKLTVFEPEPPVAANCQSLQLITTADTAAEIHVYDCQRGNSGNSWQGFEVWLFEPSANDWLRIATAEQGPCLTVAWQRNGELAIHHGHSRGALNIAKASVIYDDANGRPATISVTTEREEKECPL